MEASSRLSAEISPSLGDGLAATRYSYHSTGEDTSNSGSGIIRHSDTQFDSSTDETVIPYTIGQRASQDFISTASIADPFDPEASPKSHLSRATRRSIDTDQCGTLYEETVQLEIDLYPRDYNQGMADLDTKAGGIEDSAERERLVTSPVHQPTARKSGDASVRYTPADYRVGSCYHCMINVPPGTLIAWVFVFIATIGWSTSTWLGLDHGKDLLQYVQPAMYLSYEEITLIAISLTTVLITVIFLIIATFSSQKMSRYSFSSSKKNTFGYCLSITVVVLSFLCVLFWTGIIAMTMIPVGALSIIHLLVGAHKLDCLHPKSYGIGVMSNATSVNVTQAMSSDFLCNEDLDDWMIDAWRTLVPLLISIGFALAIEACMLGFLVSASSNARHLKERMEYINEPYSYSSDNINGNVKPVAHDKTTSNNNQGDTQI